MELELRGAGAAPASVNPLIGDALANLISNSTMKSIRSLMEIDFLKSISQLEERCLRIGEFYHMFSELNFFDEQLKRLRKITSYDVQESAKKYFIKENQVVLNVYAE